VRQLTAATQSVAAMMQVALPMPFMMVYPFLLTALGYGGIVLQSYNLVTKPRQLRYKNLACVNNL
jgi:hypothetical protein